MRTRRLMGIAALGAAAASILVIPGASAQDSSFTASSDGRALVLTAFGEGLTAGLTHSEANSDPVAVATGTGIFNPISPVGVSAAAEPDTALPEGATETEGEQCGGALPEDFAAIGLAADFACSTSSAALAEGLPSSAADSRVGSLVVNPIDAINQTPLSEVTEGVEGGLETIVDGISPILGPVDEGTGLTIEDTLGDLIDALLNGAPLVTATVGDTESTTTATAGQVVTQCVAEGARVDILDPAGVGDVDALGPALSVVVGDATTSVTVDRATAAATAEATPAIATLSGTLISLLGQEEIAVGPGQAQTIALPDPLGNVVISVAGTIEEDTEDGGKSVQASAVRIHVFEGSEELMDGVELALADCTSVAGATVAAPPAPPEAPTTAPPLLPRTGSEGPNGLAIAAVIGLAGLGVALLRRGAHT